MFAESKTIIFKIYLKSGYYVQNTMLQQVLNTNFIYKSNNVLHLYNILNIKIFTLCIFYVVFFLQRFYKSPSNTQQKRTNVNEYLSKI